VTRKGSGGQATAEFALIGAMFFLLLIGVFEVARFAYGVNALTNGAREGARWAIAGVNTPAGGGSACDTAQAGLQTAARAQIGGLPAADITVTAAPDALDTYCDVTVTWAYRPASGGFGGLFKSSSITSTAREYFN
jgi:Flp pilus assembly protein TadG